MTSPLERELAAALAASPLSRLTHFTPAMNLPSILNDRQLRSTKDLRDDVRACYRATDLQRLDGHHDKVCCSLQYPNGFYFEVARRGPDIVNYPDWVCLLLDKSVAAAEGTLFCVRNAAAGAGRNVPGVAGLRACYAQSVRGHAGRTFTRGPQHDPGSPTDVQAEVLVTAPVPLPAIHAIVFPTEEAAREEYGRLDRFGTIPPDNVRWVVSPGMFEKWTIANAVRFSRYFRETAWSPPASPTAPPVMRS